MGYAQSPDNNFPFGDPNYLGGLPTSGGLATTDGVVSSYDVFGSSTYDDGNFLLSPPYDKGRTMSHEVGHWLGLLHIWGDNPCADDYCADTPVHHDANFGCPTVVNCTATGNEMVENYMDYTDDSCMNIFTQNQKDRITTIMNNAARRVSLKTSTKNVAIPLYANDAEVKIEATHCIINLGCGAPPPPVNKQVTIYNRGTSTLTTATLNYTINGGANQVYNWTGSLDQHKFATITLSNTNFYGVLNVSVVSANGGTDQRVSNNTASGTFAIPTGSNYNYTNYVFNLQQDLWGSEITWELKNGAGTTLFSGGPYTDAPGTTLPALITQNWTLLSNQCYTFTINDSSGDGICCGSSGDGYYEIKTNSGAIEVVYGTSYGTSKSTTFTTNTLGTNKFETSNDIYLYPNPTKGTLNIHVPSGFGLPNSLSISNISGQIISRKEVSKENDLILNTSSLSKGVYFITIVKEGQKKTLQFIKE